MFCLRASSAPIAAFTILWLLGCTQPAPTQPAGQATKHQEAIAALTTQVEQLKYFRLIDVLLTAEDEELTATMKLKRSFVEKKHKHLIDSMY